MSEGSQGTTREDMARDTEDMARDAGRPERPAGVTVSEEVDRPYGPVNVANLGAYVNRAAYAAGLDPTPPDNTGEIGLP